MPDRWTVPLSYADRLSRVRGASPDNQPLRGGGAAVKAPQAPTPQGLTAVPASCRSSVLELAIGRGAALIREP